MKKLKKIASIVMLAAAVVFAVGCTKPDEPNNGGNNNGGGNNGGGETPEVPTVPAGAVDGKFSINASGDKVYFSQGNLQYQASTQTWRFGNPWDFVGGTYGITGYNPEGEPWPGTIAESNNGLASLSRCSRGDRPLVERYLEPGGLFPTMHGRVTAPSC